MEIPEPGVPQGDALHADIVAAVDEHEPRTLDLQVGAGRVFLPPLPERRPVGAAIPVEHALPGDPDVFQVLGVDQGHPPRLEVALDASREPGIIRDAIGAEEDGALVEGELDAGPEKDRAAEKRPGRDLHHAAARRVRGLDRPLDGGGIQDGAPGDRPEIGDDKMPDRGGGQRRRQWLRVPRPAPQHEPSEHHQQADAE